MSIEHTALEPLAQQLLSHLPSSILLLDSRAELYQTALKLLCAETATAVRESKSLSQINPDQVWADSESDSQDPAYRLSALANLPALKEADVVYVANPLEIAGHMAGDDPVSGKGASDSIHAKLALNLLGLLRDRVRHTVYVGISSEEAAREEAAGREAASLSRNELFSLGYQESREVTGLPLSLFRYSLRDYKQVPGWLNSKYWAHPERWKLQD